jgi:hypothetical protein
MWNYGVGRGRAVRQHWRLMNAVGLGAVAYSIALAALLFLGFILGNTGGKLMAMLLGGLYLAVIIASSVTISLRQRSVRSFFLSIAAYLALHIPYTSGLMAGIIAPDR